MTISIVIPNYNGLVLLKKNLPRLLEVLQIDKIEAEIIVVDDASVDESVNWLRAFSNQSMTNKISIKIIQNEVNKGFSYTANKGANATRSEFVVFLNTDVYPKKGFLQKSLDHFKNSSVFAVGFVDESMENGKTIIRGRGIGRWQKGFYLHKKGEVNSSQTDWVSGGSGIFRREIFFKLGGFNTIYDPFYWEDIDLSYRAKRIGFVLVFERESIVVHEHEKGAILSKYTKMDILRISYRNQFIFVWHNANALQLLMHFVWLPYHLAVSLRGDKQLFYGFLAAVKRYFSFKISSQ